MRNYYAKATADASERGDLPARGEGRPRARPGPTGPDTRRAADKPNPTTASYALQIYDVGALNKPKEAEKAASILAQTANDAPSYLRLVSYAARAGDTRTADLAGQKAIDLAPKAQKKLVEKQVEALKKAGTQQQPSG